MLHALAARALLDLSFVCLATMADDKYMCGDKPCCDCAASFGRCIANGREDPVKGCAGKGFSCVEACPGDYAWKAVYNETLMKEREQYQACEKDADPTKDWEPVKQGGSYAIVFSGGMHTFAASFGSWETQVIEASGAENVDLYFHVWGDEGPYGHGPVATATRTFAQGHPRTKAYVEGK